DVFVDCKGYSTEEFSNGMGERTTQQEFVPYLDVSAAINGNEVIFAIVNRHLDQSISTELITQEGAFKGQFSIYEVNGENVKDKNDFNSEKVKTTEKNSISVNGKSFNYSFPPHSFTLIKGSIDK
ncbi:hypothetical protein, partial [Aegicerativicinus sediminis]